MSARTGVLPKTNSALYRTTRGDAFCVIRLNSCARCIFSAPVHLLRPNAMPAQTAPTVISAARRLLAPLLASAALVLAGCAATTSNRAPADDASTAAAEASAPAVHETVRTTRSVRLQSAGYRARIEEVVARMRAACVADDYQPYFRKTACLPGGITEEMLADRTRITAAQKRAAQKVFALTHALNEETRRIMIESGTPEERARALASQSERDPLISALQEDLLAGRITWGTYNARRLELHHAASGR